jgi:dTDP-4-dehydrorhamnose reductase
LYAGGTVLRTNLFGRSHAPVRASFSDWIVNSLRTGTRMTVFDDVFFSALHLNSLSDVIACAVQQRRVGVFNAGCSDGISKAEFAFRLAEKVGLDRSLMALGQSRGAELKARRPLDMRMDSSAFERAFGMKAPTMESQIDIAAMEYLHE